MWRNKNNIMEYDPFTDFQPTNPRIPADLDDEYNFDVAAEEIAAKRGLIVVKPQDDQLQIDIDSPEALAEFWRRFNCFVMVKHKDFYFTHSQVCVVPSQRPGHYHATITVLGKTFSPIERIAYQAALNDDVLRVFLNMRRVYAGVEDPTRLFEKPKEEAPPKAAPDPDDDILL